ncbi:MAG: tannase/feruloyl esterase family alpha/beta hydrolase [Gammaproteobacteria bacterium]|jgi:feruloyl esterase|nr:tannase/feruloyl esterase family alpha/beta hydrolase [Gammaproteobacteria bacterium]
MLKKFINIALLFSSWSLVSIAMAQDTTLLCETMNSQTLSGGVIAHTEFVEAGSFNLPAGVNPRSFDDYPNLRAFCRISAVLSPVEGSNIRIELWMPAENWNEKLLAVGNGGFAGSISYNALAEALVDGFAAVSTNTGHEGNDPDFLLNDEQLTDFAHRAIHEMTVAAKSLAASYYSVTPRFTYFNGCSTGGRQALTAAQRYPNDFDAIVAGAPANSTVRMTMQQLWNSRIVNDTPGLDLSVDDFALLNDEVLKTCDGLDGLLDGIIENPSICMAEPSSIEGLSAFEVDAINKVYQGAMNPESGELILPGFAKGSELGWTAVVNRQPFAYSNGIQSYVVNQDPTWDFMNLNFARDLNVLDERINALGMQAIDPDISDFINNGGKLLLYHGWNDPLISPFNSINYYNEVLATVTASAAESVRLFMMPGVNHCRGGIGFDTWSKLQTIADWRESGVAPERINAAHIEDGVESTRPLCAYPQVAVYTSGADSSAAASFQCR